MSTENENTENTVAEGVAGISLQENPADAEWEEENEEELDSFITEDQKIIPDIVDAIKSDDRQTRLTAATKIRRLLQKRPPHVGVQPVIDSGLVPVVVEMLSSKDQKFLVEAAWIISNIASGTSAQTATVVAGGAIPKLTALFPTEASDVQENALWALGNIGGDCWSFRDKVVDAGGIKPALDVLNDAEGHTEKVRNTAAWVLTCYLTPHTRRPLTYDTVRPMIDPIIKFLNGPSDISDETMGYAVKALDLICNNEDAAEYTINTGILPRLVELCTKGDSNLRYNAIRCMGQFTAGTEKATDAAIAAGFLEALKPCMGFHLVSIRENACWAASNVAAGTLSQVNALIESGLLPILVAVVCDKEEVTKPRNEATWALANLVNTAKTHPELVDKAIEAGCVEALSEALAAHHYNTERLAVQSLQKLLKTRAQDKVTELLQAADGIARLRRVRDEANTRSTEVAGIAHAILRDHYPDFVRRARV